MRKIQSECLSNCAYSEKNREQQEIKFDIANVPKWERDIIDESYKVRKKFGKKIFKELELLLILMKENDKE